MWLQNQVDQSGSVDKAALANGLPRKKFRDACTANGVTAAPPVIERWGFGPAPLVKARANEIVVFLSDIHFPYQDAAAVASSLSLIRSVRPDRVVLNGDICDFFQLSRFNKALERLDSLQDEIDMGVRFRRDVRNAAPDSWIDETEGNHDNRVTSYVKQNARALASLRALEPANLFGYQELGIHWHSGAGFRLRPDFLVKHGTIVRGEGGAAAKAELLAAGISGVSGHTHRLATYRRAGYAQRQWTEQGCLCRTDPDYVVGKPNWQQGIAVGEFTRDHFHIHEVPFVGGKLRLGTVSF